VVEAAGGARVLVASTDPAHSLGDALNVRLSPVPRPIALRAPGPQRRAGTAHRGSLHAVELSAAGALARWLARHRGALGDVLQHGTWLDRDDVDLLLELPLPGVDELAGMLELARLGRVDVDPLPPPGPRGRRSTLSAAYDIIVVDTAPTGHTLRLLGSPEAVLAVAHALEGLQREHRIVRESFARVLRPEAADRFIALLAAQATRMADVLRDEQRTAFDWVTLPEMLSLAETENAVEAIEQRGIRVAHVVVNRILPRGSRCPVCDARRKEEARVIAALTQRLGVDRSIRLVSAHLREPRGVDALAAIGRETIAPRRQAVRTPAAARRRPRIVLSLPPQPRRTGSPAGIHRLVTAESIESIRGARLLLVAGKGGVGKTTVAAAVALRLARAHPDCRMLLLSTDPAHSLGHAFGLAPGVVGDEPRAVPRAPANLLVRELDAVAALNAQRAELERAFDEVATSFGAGAAGQPGAGLLELAPPGIDELYGMLSIVAASEHHQLMVVDMAPTGHALRLLEQPDAARQWLQAILRVLLKYRSIARPTRLVQELLALATSIRQLQNLLHDHARTRVIVVTRAAEVPRLETARLLSRLRRLKVFTPAVVVNAMTLGAGRCVRCRETARIERVELTALRRSIRAAARGSAIIETALAAPPPRGVGPLEEWAARWIAGA